MLRYITTSPHYLT